MRLKMSKTPTELIREAIERMSDVELGRWMRRLMCDQSDAALGSVARHMFQDMSDEEIAVLHERNERATYAAGRPKAKA